MRALDRSIGISREPRPRRRTRWLAATAARRLVVVSLTLLLATACSSVRIGYNNADTLLLYALDSYFDLDDAQQQLARERTRALLAWHRATQLPDYAQLLREAERRMDGPVSAADVLALYERINRSLLALGDHAAPDLARLALALRPAQIAHFERKLAEDTSKARRELVRFAGKEAPDERLRRYSERAESWFGTLSAAQVEILRRSLVERPASQAWWLQERERRQHELIALLRRIETERPGEATAAVWLRTYFAGLAQPEDPQQRARVLEFRGANAELIAQLVASASAEQKSTLFKRLRGYAEDFTALASAGVRG